MFSGIATVLSLVLLLQFVPASASVLAYYHPPRSYTTQSNADPSVLLAHHLRLDAFFPSPTPDGGIVLGDLQTFVGEGARDALVLSIDTPWPQDIILELQYPSFTLPTSSKLLRDQYSRVARKSYRAVIDDLYDPPRQVFHRFLDLFSVSSLNSESLEKFLRDLSVLSLFVEETDEGGDRFGSFHIKGLPELEREWARDSEVYRTATAALKAVIQSASSKAISLVVILPEEPILHQLDTRQPPQSPLPGPLPKIPATAPVFSTSTCFATVDACLSTTASCSSRGHCVGVKRAGRTCFVCECHKAPHEESGKNISWVGDMCQKEDLSQEFSLITGTVLFLVLLVGGSISMLYSVGGQELPGTLMVGIAGTARHD